MSFRMKLMNLVLKLSVKPVFSYTPLNALTLSVPRELVKLMGSVSPPDNSSYVRKENAHNIPVELIEYYIALPKKDTKAILYLHGGAYFAGSPVTHRNITTRLSHYAGCTVIVPDYRKSPEHPYPAALEDACETYNWLLFCGYQPQNIIIAGDSAGGNLTLSTALKIKELGLPMCAGLVCISPWTDLSASGETIKTHKRRDPMLPSGRVTEAGKLYAGEIPLNDPRVSPLFADLSGLPPILIHVGSEEVLLSDSIDLHKRATSQNVKSELKIWSNAPHVFQMFAGLIPQSSQSLREIAAFSVKTWSKK